MGAAAAVVCADESTRERRELSAELRVRGVRGNSGARRCASSWSWCAVPVCVSAAALRVCRAVCVVCADAAVDQRLASAAFSRHQHAHARHAHQHHEHAQRSRARTHTCAQRGEHSATDDGAWTDRGLPRSRLGRGCCTAPPMARPSRRVRTISTNGRDDAACTSAWDQRRCVRRPALQHVRLRALAAADSMRGRRDRH